MTASKADLHLGEIRSWIGAIRHHVDGAWGASRDACRDEPEFNRAESRDVINEDMYQLLQGLWCIELELDALEQLQRKTDEHIHVADLVLAQLPGGGKPTLHLVTS